MDTKVVGEAAQKEGWVVCRIFKKKNHYKSLDSDYSPRMNAIGFSSTTTAATTTRSQLNPTSSSSNNTQTASSLEHILHDCIGRGCMVDKDFETKYINKNETLGLYESDVHKFTSLPNLESPNSCASLTYSNNYQRPTIMLKDEINDGQSTVELTDLNNWAALDRLVASHLHGQKYYDTNTMISSSSKQQLSCFNHDIIDDFNFCSSEITNVNINSCDQSDLWSII